MTWAFIVDSVLAVSSLAAIVCLLLVGCPAAVARFVIAVVVDAVKRLAFWSWTHISQECRERINPSLAHDDASAAVGNKLAIVGIAASSFGVLPRVIFRRITSAMFRETSRSNLLFQASATPRHAVTKRGELFPAFCSAIAATADKALQPIVTAFAEDNPSAIANTDQLLDRDTVWCGVTL